MGLECVSGSAKKPKAYLVSRLRLCQVAKLDLRNKHLSIEKVSKTGVISTLAYLWNPGTWTRGGQRRDRDHRLEPFRIKNTWVRKLIMETLWNV